MIQKILILFLYYFITISYTQNNKMIPKYRNNNLRNTEQEEKNKLDFMKKEVNIKINEFQTELKNIKKEIEEKFKSLEDKKISSNLRRKQK
jgi:hypothetical protein